jgi:hypothetical protein
MAANRSGTSEEEVVVATLDMFKRMYEDLYQLWEKIVKEKQEKQQKRQTYLSPPKNLARKKITFSKNDQKSASAPKYVQGSEKQHTSPNHSQKRREQKVSKSQPTTAKT